MLLCLLLLIVQPESTQFISARYGLSLTLPAGWEILERERDDRIFLAGVSTPDARASAALLCELALAPESLHEWRTRIQKQADTGRIAGLQRNEVVKTPKGERLDTLIEFRPDPDTLFVEHTIRLVAHRQLYSFQLRADSNAYARVRPQFDALIESLAFTPPQTGTKAIDPDKNRWEQTEYKFALNLPQGWQPVLAPAEVALFYATAPAQGIWSDNCLVIARPRS